MLYGDLQLQKQILKDAKKYADENELKIIFASMVGSISKGLEYSDSDYDTRFLYVRKDFPEKICIPSQMKEEELVKRYYPKEDLVYEWIPFWELTSFLQFLETPSFENDFSVGLYNIVGWTFQSPYQWDPYGIRNKIMPLIDDIFIKEYEISYHLKEIERWYQKENDEIIAKNYMYALHAALTIDWSISRGTQPPIYFDTLLYSCCNSDFCQEASKMVQEAKEKSYVINSETASELHGTHFKIKTKHVKILDNYIQKQRERGEKLVSEFRKENRNRDNLSQKITQMYEIIKQSVIK